MKDFGDLYHLMLVAHIYQQYFNHPYIEGNKFNKDKMFVEPYISTPDFWQAMSWYHDRYKLGPVNFGVKL